MDRFLSSLRRFFSELKRRNVYKVGATYAVVAFVTLRAARLIFPATTLEGVYDALVVVAVVGFPLALVLAWAIELTPEGVRQTRAADTASEEPLKEPLEEPSEEGARAQVSTQPDLWVGASVLVLLLLGGWWLFGGLLEDVERGSEEGSATGPTSREAADVEKRSIAVLPFEVSGAGAEEWRDGMVTALSLNLDGAAGLRAIADRRIFAAAEQLDTAQAKVGSRPALEVARRVGARYAIVGSAVQLGADLRLGAEVFETPTGERLGQVEARGAPDSVTALTDRLTRKILRVLLEKSEEQIPSVDLASITTKSLTALKAFLEGEAHLRGGEYRAATEDFETATKQDSTFALAYARLATSRSWVQGSSGRETALRQAYRLSGRLPARERRLIHARHLWVVQDRAVEAANILRGLAEDYSGDPSAWYWLGETLFHNWVPHGWPEAEEAFAEANTGGAIDYG